MASFWAELQERQEGSARERKHGSRPQDWPLDHGTAFSVAAEKALGRQAAGPGRCLGATARGCARRRRAAPAAPRLCLGARSRRSVGSCGEPRAEARVPFTVGVTRVSGRLSRLPSFRRVFPLSGPYARALPLRPAGPRRRPDVPRRAERVRTARAGKLTTTCAGGRGGAGRRRGRGNRAREGERKRWREQLNPTSPRVQSRGRPLGEARVLQGSPRRWALVGPWRSLKREALFSAEDRMSS